MFSISVAFYDMNWTFVFKNILMPHTLRQKTCYCVLVFV